MLRLLKLLLALPLACALRLAAPRAPAAAASRARVRLAAVDDKVEVKECKPARLAALPRCEPSKACAHTPSVLPRTDFNNEGFSRWNRIYSEDGEVNAVQLDIRTGHAQTVDKVLAWVAADGSAAEGRSFCEAGCGVGSLALPLAQRGASVSASDISAAMVGELLNYNHRALNYNQVSASDISAAMVGEARERAAAAGLGERMKFATSDLESVDGSYDTVTCIDVMIHYPQVMPLSFHESQRVPRARKRISPRTRAIHGTRAIRSHPDEATHYRPTTLLAAAHTHHRRRCSQWCKGWLRTPSAA
jgi:2-polyprenyl-3-methyl-5-hydroxy-6-metoxy-1,4-benzoquinol methylase